MDELASCYIEVHSDHYKLKRFSQLPEHILGYKYLKYVEDCNQMSNWAQRVSNYQLAEKTINACNYIKYHLVGRNFIFESLANHLLDHRSPDMRQFVSQFAGEVWHYINLDFTLLDIDPYSLEEIFQGDVSLPQNEIEATYSGRRPSRPIWFRFRRRWGSDNVRFSLDGEFFQSIFEYNTGWLQRESNLPTEERILQQ